MTEFEKLLKEHRRLAVQIDDERNYLEHLERQLRAVEKQLKAMAIPVVESQQEAVAPFLTGASKPSEVELESQSPSASAIQDAVTAVAELGNGVTAQQLAEHLGITPDAARLRLQRAARDGLIARMALGRYRAKRASSDEAKTSSARGPNDTEGIEREATQDESSINSPESPNGIVAKVD